MKAKELRSKTSEELKVEAESLFRAQFNLRMQSSQEGAKTHQFKEVRRGIARLKTILSERERENG
jgi:large subunit ribosomal protein L29